MKRIKKKLMLLHKRLSNIKVIKKLHVFIVKILEHPRYKNTKSVYIPAMFGLIYRISKVFISAIGLWLSLHLFNLINLTLLSLIECIALYFVLEKLRWVFGRTFSLREDIPEIKNKSDGIDYEI